MTKSELRYTFADNCADAVRFVSGATGMICSFDLPTAYHWEPPTSDPVVNQVDVYSSSFDEMVGVVIVPGNLPLLPVHLSCHPWQPPVEIAPPRQPAAPPPVGPPELARLARRLRELVDLPVADLAAMVGIGRRQFYNLLQHGTTSPETELRLRHLADEIERLAGVVGEDPAAMRSALLTPVGEPARSLFEVAVGDEHSKLHGTFVALLDRIERRGLRQVPRGVPRRRTGKRGEATARTREALRDLPSIDLGPEVEGEH